jgi:hypothetical protein
MTMCRAGRTEAWHMDHIPLNRIAANARVDKADGSDSDRVMAALSHAAVIGVSPQPTSHV